MNDILLIFGGHSTGIEILDLVKENFPNRFSECLNVVEADYSGNADRTITDDQLPKFIQKNKGHISYIISMSNQRFRYKFVQYSLENNLKPVTLIHPSSFIAKTAKIGSGVYVAANVSISSNAQVRDHVIINYNAIIGHDSILHEHVIINPGVVIGGKAKLMERVLVGANAFIMQGKQIGSDCSIDALTYVNDDLKPKVIATSQKMKIFP